MDTIPCTSTRSRLGGKTGDLHLLKIEACEGKDAKQTSK